ncbi:hypothetical protein PAYE108092_20505 [Paracoccus yeei]
MQLAPDRRLRPDQLAKALQRRGGRAVQEQKPGLALGCGAGGKGLQRAVGQPAVQPQRGVLILKLAGCLGGLAIDLEHLDGLDRPGQQSPVQTAATARGRVKLKMGRQHQQIVARAVAGHRRATRQQGLRLVPAQQQAGGALALHLQFQHMVRRQVDQHRQGIAAQAGHGNLVLDLDGNGPVCCRRLVDRDLLLTVDLQLHGRLLPARVADGSAKGGSPPPLPATDRRSAGTACRSRRRSAGTDRPEARTCEHLAGRCRRRPSWKSWR